MGNHGQGCSAEEVREVAPRFAENKVRVHDFHATILHLLGTDRSRLTHRPRRPRPAAAGYAWGIVKDIVQADPLHEPALRVMRKLYPSDPPQTMFFVGEATASASSSLMAMRTKFLQPAGDEVRESGSLDEPFTGPGTFVHEFLRK